MYDLIQAGENTYYIDCPAKAGIWRTDRGVYLIDSGGDKDAGKKLRQILEKNGWPLLGILNVPSNSNLGERVLCRHGSFASVSDYLRRHPDQVDRAFETLSYFDTMNLADRIRCPILASVGLCDPVCPAKCYFASYNRITSPKEIALYPFNEHDGAGAFHMERELRFVRDSGILGDRKG